MAVPHTMVSSGAVVPVVVASSTASGATATPVLLVVASSTASGATAVLVGVAGRAVPATVVPGAHEPEPEPEPEPDDEWPLPAEPLDVWLPPEE